MSKVANGYRVEQYVDDIGIIPNALCREVVALQVTYGEVVFCTIVGGGISANFQTVDAVVVESVPTEQWTTVRIRSLAAIDNSGLPSGIATQLCIHRVNVDGNSGACIVLEGVIQEDRLVTTHEDGRAATAVVSKRIVFVRWATQSVDRALSTHPVAVVLEDRVSDPSVSLLQFQRAKGLECTF